MTPQMNSFAAYASQTAAAPVANVVVRQPASGNDRAGRAISATAEHQAERARANQALNQQLLGWLGEIAAGDQAAFTQLYDQTNRPVFALAQRILSDRESAEEVTLDVFMQVWRQAASYDTGRGTPLAWLMMMTRSRAIDRLRSATVYRTRESEDLERVSLTAAVDEESPEAASIFTQRRRLVRAALAHLTPAQRTLIEAAFFEGLSHTELAERFQLPLGTVKTRIRTGLLVLRQHLPEQ